MPRYKPEKKRDFSHFHASEAARNMLVKVPTALAHETAGAVRARLLETAASYDTVIYIYVLDAGGRLKGAASIKELLRAEAATPMSRFEKKELAVVHPRSRLPAVAARAITHNVKALPVVDDDRVFLGVVGTDAILRTMEAEHVRHVLTTAGLRTRASFVDVVNAKLSDLIRWRTSWLIAGLFGGMIATLIVKSFSRDLEDAIALAFFIPVMVYMGDAVGTQTQTLFVRGLSLGHINVKRYVVREIASDVVIGLVISLLLTLFAWASAGSPAVAAIVGFSLFVIVSTAGLMAIAISQLLVKFKRDPAIGGGPFATIIQDILSLFIYFAIASAFLI